MRPAARLQAVVEILGALGATAQPADRFLRDWFRKRRYAGSKDRAAINERVFAILRHHYSLAWRMGGDAPRRLVIASLLAEGGEAETLFDGSEYGPAPLDEAERQAIATPPGEPPLHVKGEFPPFLEPELTRAFGAQVLEEMQALQGRAPVDLRTNTLKTSRDALATALAAKGFHVTASPYSPWGLRLPPGEGLSNLSTSKLFAEGAFEFQDEAAQIAALLCAAKPGLRVLDMAAGGGGKSLALAAAMQNEGQIVASDKDPGRLAQLEPRAARAGATNIRTSFPPPERGRLGGGPTVDPSPNSSAQGAAEFDPPLSGEGKYDLVLVDSPCSGTGTWRRQPELRWRLTPERLAELTALQDVLLVQAAQSVSPGGRLVYATCSLLPCENEDRIARFLENQPDFSVVPAAGVWHEVAGTEPPPGLEEFFRASPLRTGTDGFFTAVLQRVR